MTVNEQTSSVVRAGLRYFALVFAAGFVLGAIRVPLLEPRLGERAAQLLEMPIMLGVVFLAAGHVVARGVRGAGRGRGRGRWLAVGGIALLLLVAAEVVLIVAFAEESLSADLAQRDPVAGAAYLLSLALFAGMPWLRARTAKLSPTPSRSTS